LESSSQLAILSHLFAIVSKRRAEQRTSRLSPRTRPFLAAGTRRQARPGPFGPIPKGEPGSERTFCTNLRRADRCTNRSESRSSRGFVPHSRKMLLQRGRGSVSWMAETGLVEEWAAGSSPEGRRGPSASVTASMASRDRFSVVTVARG
jgi:hypothetical protein